MRDVKLLGFSVSGVGMTMTLPREEPTRGWKRKATTSSWLDGTMTHHHHLRGSEMSVITFGGWQFWR